MSETNLQLFPGIFRSTVGGENPGFFLHSDGRVGIGNKAPTARPLWSSDDADRNKLNVTGHTHIDGNLNVTGHLYGDGSTLNNVTAVITGNWLTDGAGGPQPADIKYDLGNVGIGGAASGTNKLKVHGNIEATGYVSTPYLYRSSHNSGYMVGSYNSVGANSTMVNPIYTIGSSYMPTGDNAIGNMYGIGYSHGNFTSLLTSGWGMYVAANGTPRIGLNGDHGHIKCTGYVDAGTEVYAQNWFRTRGNSGHYWEPTSNGNGWHIYPKDRSDMYLRTGSGNGGICGIIGSISTPRGYVHWTTSSQIGFLTSYRHWSLLMDDAKNCTVYGVNYSGGYLGRSDTRIKKNIVHADDTTALNLIREIKPRIYEYIDTPRLGTHSVYGFIAQEIKALMPKAVTVHEGEIPNIYQNATFDKEQMIITFENFDTGNLHQTKDIICMVDMVEKHLSIKSVLNSKQLEIEEDDEFKALLEESEIADEIFVWGQTVDDFHSIDKNYIFTVATAALQEVDRQLQTEKEKVKSLEERLAALEAIVLNQ